MTIRTNPPASYVDDYEIGATPVSTISSTGTRRIRIAKDGYETLTVRTMIPTRGTGSAVGLFAETVTPQIRDHRT